MSIGSIIGGVVGGVVGFFLTPILGPGAIYYGAVLGFGIGMAIDPMTPDMPNLGSPNPDENVMKSEIGVPVPDLIGTAKITGHLLCFGNERNQAVYVQSTGGGKGGGGGGDAQVSGYSYYMSWALGFCACPGDSKINTLYAIYKNDDAEAVWEGELDCPVSGGHETIVIDGIGSVDFYFGTNDQAANPGVAEIITYPTLNTPYRNMCWAFFDDCYIGEYNRTPTYKFIMKKIPEYSFNNDDSTIQTFDVNPANAMYYILSNLAGLPTSWLDSDDFETIAGTLFGELRGVCVLLDRQQSVLSYLESINSHVDNIIRYGSDAKFHPKLIRNDYSIVSLPTIDESVMLEDPSFSRGSWIDTINELKVQYSEIIDAETRAPSEMPLGEMVAPLSKRSDPQIYTYLVDTGAIVKIDTSLDDPIVTDYLVINDDPVNYTLDYNKYEGSTRGGYCISKSYDKIWYLFQDESNGNIKLVEVDISSYPMILTQTSIHTDILDYGASEYINDGCGTDNYCFFPTSVVSGRILRFDTNHTLLDETFGYPTSGDAEAIHSITINPNQAEIAWLYNADPTTVKIAYSSYNFVIDHTISQLDGGADSSKWQNFLRYDEIHDHIFRQRIYWPANGVAYYYSSWDQVIGRAFIQNLQYMKQYLGGNISYFYVLQKDDSGSVSHLIRFTNVDSTLGGAVPQISINADVYTDAFSRESHNSIYNENSDKSCLLRYNESDGWNRIATFNNSLSNLSDPTLDTIYWGQ